jgi:hypothetical protein
MQWVGAAAAYAPIHPHSSSMNGTGRPSGLQYSIQPQKKQYKIFNRD